MEDEEMTTALCFLFPILCGVCVVAGIRLVEMFREGITD
jgi:hypothetical protein